MKRLTRRQEDLLELLKKYIAKHGYPPTVREICKELNLKSTATVQTHIENLISKGYIKKNNNKNRSIELLIKNNYAEVNKHVKEISLLGKVQTTNPIEEINYPSEHFNVPSALIPKGKQAFAIKVRGDAMSKVGIYDNDIAIVQIQNGVKKGDIVVILINKKDIIIRRFESGRKIVKVVPENDNMEPETLTNVNILGKVIAVYRKY